MTTYVVPKRVLVVGAGVIGLSTAWSLREHGVEVTVVDKIGPGAGASWQNAGLVSPALTVPLPEPAVLRYGVKAVLSAQSPVRLLWTEDSRQLARFMIGMVRHCTRPAWQRAMAAYTPLNAQVELAYERQRSGGVDVDIRRGDLVACFARPEVSTAFLEEVKGVVAAGQSVGVEMLTGAEARAYEPHLSSKITHAIKVLGQQYLTPSSYVLALASAARSRGIAILKNTRVSSISRHDRTLVAATPSGELEADAVVLANGAWLSDLAADHGVRTPVYGGRGYSFTVVAPKPLTGPTYFPAERVAVTPQGDRVRFAGIMEFGSPDAPLQRRRIETIVASVRSLLDGIAIDDRADEWVGPRPLTIDGIPLVGETRTPGVYVAGGHGMWGVTLAPLTGALLADQIATGVAASELGPLDPLR